MFTGHGALAIYGGEEMKKAAIAGRFPLYRRRDSNPHNLSVTRP